MKKPIKVAIAEDHDLVRQGMNALLSEEEELKVVFDACNGQELIEKLKKQSVDVVLLDLEMPVLNGHQALKIIKERFSRVKVLIVSMHYTDEFIAEGITAGARGFLPKNSDIERVIDAIFAVNEQGYYFDDKISRALLNRLLSENEIEPKFTEEALSPREVQILEMICEGKMNKDISDLLFISVRTVESHRKSIYEKTNSRNLAGLIVYAIKHGIYSLN